MTIRNPDIVVAEGIKTITDEGYTPNSSNYCLLFSTGNSDRTLTLPAPSPEIQGQRLFVKKIDSGSGDVIIDAATNGATIDGSNTMHIADQYGGVEIFCGIDTWYCLADGRAPKTAGYTGNLDCATTAVGTYQNGHLVSVA